MCGENGLSSVYLLHFKGSSPRVRGKRPGIPPAGTAHGLIPACAGKTRYPYQQALGSAAHPRVCGENEINRSSESPFSGSSPRVRGKLLATLGDEHHLGLIPACAGKTTGAAPPTASSPAHPRVCGENSSEAGDEKGAVGSSPRVRGKLDQARRRLLDVGLIPACAGKTGRSSSTTRTGTAHPRVCGENLRLRRIALHGVGSSPRVRGKPAGRVVPTDPRGLIPACAGKTIYTH